MKIIKFCLEELKKDMIERDQNNYSIYEDKVI